MAFDVSKAALPALWKSDPAFVELAKYLYGEDVSLETVQKDLFGKMDPAPSDVHVQEPVKVGRKKKPMVVDERGIEKGFVDTGIKAMEVGERFGQKHINTAAKLTQQAGPYDRGGSYIRAAGHNVLGHAVHNHPIGVPAVAAAGTAATGGLVVHHHYNLQKNLEVVGKAFVDLVEKAHDAGLIDDEGNLDMEEIEKSRQYVRDHTGKFASQGKHTGKMVAGLAAAGALAGTGGVLAAKSPKAMKYAGESVKFVGQHLKSSDPTERHVARALLPHALKATGKAVGTAGLSATMGAGGVYEGTRTYQEMRDHAIKKDWKKWDAEHKEGAAAGGLAVAAGASEGAGRLIGRNRKKKAEFAHSESRMSEEMAGAFRDYAHSASGAKGAEHYGTQAGHFMADASDKAREAGRFARQGGKALRHGRTGALVAGSAAGIAGLGALEAHAAKKPIKKDAHEVTWEGDFSKVDEDKRQVFGWASVTEMDGKPVVDLQGDYIHPEDMETAAYDYVLKSRVGGDMHSRVDEYGNLIEKADKPLHVSDLIESVVFTPEKCEAMGISKSVSGRWWTGFKINDPAVWETVKTGERTGFSIHGAGLRKSIDIEELDPEAELIGKAYQESDNMSEFIDNLCTLEDVTGHQGFGDLAKHLHHGLDAVPQVNAQQARNAGVFGSMGSGIGGLAGGAIGAKMGHVGEGAGIGATIGGMTGTAVGMHHGKDRPQRPPSVHAALGGVAKGVDNTNRMGGSVGVRQNMYQQQALQEATQMLAPQVAQHIQAMQEQRWQQQMAEQQMMQQQAGQQGQNFAVQMGPYSNGNSSGQRSQGNPLAPSQQGPTTGQDSQTPFTPQTFSV